MTRERRAKFTDFEPMREELLQLRSENDRLQRHATNMIGAMNAANEALRAEVERLIERLHRVTEARVIVSAENERRRADNLLVRATLRTVKALTPKQDTRQHMIIDAALADQGKE